MPEFINETTTSNVQTLIFEYEEIKGFMDIAGATFAEQYPLLEVWIAQRNPNDDIRNERQVAAMQKDNTNLRNVIILKYRNFG